jgi:acetyl esterase/lipase
VTEQLPPDVIAQLISMDPAITPELVMTSWALLRPFHDKVGYTAPRIDRDLRYGNHERNRLDVHRADAEAGDEQAGAPVFVFVHGGGFTGGDKHVPGSPQYDHIGAWAVRNGWVGVTITYRLAPEFTWPSGAQDVAAALQWVRENIVAYGGDPARIVVAGHSAGCVHVASYLAGQGGGSLDGIRGAGLLSGFYQIPATDVRGEPETSYFGRWPSAEVATLPALLETEVPLIFAIAERDPEFSQSQIAALTAAWFARKGTVPPVIWSEGHNHISQIASIGVDDLALGAQLARFVDRVTLLSPEKDGERNAAAQDPGRRPPRDPGTVRLLRVGPEHRRCGAGALLLHRRRLVRAPAAGHLPRPRADQDPAQSPLVRQARLVHRAPAPGQPLHPHPARRAGDARQSVLHAGAVPG